MWARQLIDRVSGQARIVLDGDFVSSIGTGLTVPFLVVYLDRMRGLSAGAATLSVAVLALGSVIGNLGGGGLGVPPGTGARHGRADPKSHHR